MASVYMAAQLIKNADALKIYVNKFDVNNKYNDFDKMKNKVLETLKKMEFHCSGCTYKKFYEYWWQIL